MPRTSRRGGASLGGHTPAVSTPASQRQRPPSPLSPARKSRMEEKKEMQNLNDRLASYIERVRSQEIEINGLQQQVSTIEETKSTELVTMRNAYHAEMGQLRKALDDTAKERARYQIDAEKYEKEARDLRSALKDKERAYDSAAKDLKNMTARANSLATDFSNAEAEIRELKPENESLKKKLRDAKKNLEEETLRRIDLQNQLQTSQEGLQFENSLLEQQLNETKVRRQIEISEIDGKLQHEYEEKLQQSLAELRESYEKQLSENRDEFSRVYDTKLKNLQDKLDRERIASSGNTQEMRELETRVTSLTSRNLELESSNQTLSKRLADLLQEMEDAAKGYRSDMARKDGEIRSKDEQMEEMLRDYRDLMDIKVALDMEIAAYRKLLEGEEARLGMSPTGSPIVEARATPKGRGIKRKRIMEEESTELLSEHQGKGDIMIEPIDTDGKFIAIRNKSDDEINIGGWALTNTAEGQDVTYKFHRTTTLQPGEVCTVWSADTHQEHEPPLNLVMKRGGWKIGDENSTILKSKDGEEEAARFSHKEKTLKGSIRYGSSQMYSQEGDPEGKNCAIM